MNGPGSQDAITVANPEIARSKNQLINKSINSKGFWTSRCDTGQSAHQEAISNTINQTNIMKTKAFSILLAVLASASMVPVASAQRANGNFGSQRIDKGASSQEAKPAPQVLPEACISNSCCTTKFQTRTAGGRSAITVSEKVKSCDTTCKIATNNHRSTCGKGRRA
jgi:hypothetical protein